MELKEIKEIVAEIITDIEKNTFDYTHRKYDTFFGNVGMLKRRNLPLLTKFDYQFKKKGITLWFGKEAVKKISDFRRGETITFRRTDQDKTTEEAIVSLKKVQNKYAGEIKIDESESGILLYEHQQKAYAKLQNDIVTANKKPFAGLLVLPTGGGKTLTAAHWISKNILDKNKKVLWVAHRHELLEQALQTFSHKLSFHDIFQDKKSFSYRILSGIHDKPINIKQTDDIIFASKDSLNAGFEHLYRKWIKNNTDEIFLVIDEAHHATAKTYRRLIKNIRDSVSTFRMLGLTATPFRTADSEKSMLAKVFPDDIIYKIDLRTLIRLGILSEPYFEEVSTKQNFLKDLSDEQIDQLNYFDIDSIGKDIAKSIAENDERNMIIVNKYVTQKNKYKQTIVFALNVDNAIALNALFRNQGVRSDYVVSTIKDAFTGITTSSKDNKNKIDKFRSGEIEVLINVNILTEGTDVPNVQSIFLARPTISTILMTQMIGRGLRGLLAGGTKEAYIVSFIDEWQNKVSWVNPEKLFIEDNTDFTEKNKEETKRQLIRLVSINKIEEFAILTNQIIDPKKREEIEQLNFIERFPVGIYQFKYLQESDDESLEKNCEVLVYDNIRDSFTDFINNLAAFFVSQNLSEKDILSEAELMEYAEIIEQTYFNDCQKYPAYYLQDIKDILQYYAVQGELPLFIELKERDKYDIDKIASEIIEKDFGERAQTELINNLWDKNEVAWQTFFNYNKQNFLREINLAKTKINHPELFKRKFVIPADKKELIELEKLNLHDLGLENPDQEKLLRKQVFEKFTDVDGYYFCKESGYRSKNKLDFQIDHIVSMHNGGLTVLENLQLLTKSENAKKGAN